MSLPKRVALRPADLAGRRVGIVGIGREGLSLAEMLIRLGSVASLVAVDQAESERAVAWRERFGDTVPLMVGASEIGHSALRAVDVWLMSPGIPPHSEIFQKVVETGGIVSSGTDLFMNEHADHIIAVTGSKGKSTTSALIHHLLKEHGVDVAWGGNVGIPLWDVPPATWYVAEISSYQCSSLTASPHTAVLTALFEEHLDWHGGADQYYADKLNLVGHGPTRVVAQGADHILRREIAHRYPNLPVTWAGEDVSWSLGESGGERGLLHDGELVLRREQFPVVGDHNARNVVLALIAAESVVTMTPESVRQALATFRPLPHRLEQIAQRDGVTYINDSLATNPQAAVAALRALRDRRVIIFLGGHDRGVNDSVLRDEVLDHPPAMVVGLPDSGARVIERIRSWFAEAGREADRPRLELADSMVDAVRLARSCARPGDVVVMSPGAPSFGQYRDYEHRAEAFREAVEGAS